MWCGVSIEQRPCLAECKSPMFKKTDRFRKVNLKVHDKTSHHIVCLNDAEKANRPSHAVPIDQTTLGRLFLKCRWHQYNRVVSLFNTAYTVAKHSRPYTDFVWMSQMQNQNGLDLGGNYMNDKGCSLFVKQTAIVLRIFRVNFIRQIL